MILKFITTTLLIAVSNPILTQTFELDSINFYDKTNFMRTIEYTKDGRLDYIKYEQINGTLKKFDFFDHNQRIIKDQIWDKILLKEVKYSYLKKGQIIKRFDVLNNHKLPTYVRVHFNYPATARENEIGGKIEVKLIFDENCMPIQFKILNKLGYGIDEEVEEKMHLMLFLSKKYEAILEDCNESDKNLILNFSLD